VTGVDRTIGQYDYVPVPFGEILSHEDISCDSSRVFAPRRDEHPDIRQEAYARVYEAARKARPVAPKAFLFATARHLMADRVRRERIVSIQAGG
jgi:RNA polymerase sigma-70 factor (ECF subfamily)